MKRILIIAILLIAISFSCTEDFITKENPNEVSTDLVLNDINQISAAVVGIYDGLQDDDYYGKSFILIPDIMAMDVKQQPDNSNRGTSQYKYDAGFNPQNSFAGDLWLEGYRAINKANLILGAIGSVNGDAALKNQIKGETLALRALAHFDLVRYFAFNYTASEGAPNANGQGGHLGVPVVTTTLLPNAKPSRNTVAEVYDQVIEDLEESITLMDDTENFSRVRFTKAAAQALLARVNLYKGDWAEAEAAATAVINNTNYSFIATGSYVASWNGNTPNTESIFELQFSNTDNVSSEGLGYIYSPAGYGDFWPTTDLDDVFNEISDPATDVRGALWDTSSDPPVAKKYLGPLNSANVDNTKIFRLSEMYLIRAEARAEQSNFTGSRADLDALRAARGAPASTATDGELIDFIMKERRVELAFEGHAIFDVKRRKMDVTRNDCQTAVLCTITYPDHHFAIPIPQSEIDVNPNMVQNDGY